MLAGTSAQPTTGAPSPKSASRLRGRHSEYRAQGTMIAACTSRSSRHARRSKMPTSQPVPEHLVLNRQTAGRTVAWRAAASRASVPAGRCHSCCNAEPHPRAGHPAAACGRGGLAACRRGRHGERAPAASARPQPAARPGRARASPPVLPAGSPAPGPGRWRSHMPRHYAKGMHTELDVGSRDAAGQGPGPADPACRAAARPGSAVALLAP